MGCPIYSVSWGVVTYAARVTQPGYAAFGNLLVVKSELPDGTIIYCRYAHHDNTQVKVGDTVHPGQYLADVSDAYGVYAPHLDFSISPTNILAAVPWDWPGGDLARVYRDYINPCSFIGAHTKMPNDLTALKAAFSNLKAATADMETAISAFEAPPEPEPAPVPATVIGATGANIRQSPTTNSKILLLVPVNTKLTVLDSKIDANGYRWMQVTAGPVGSVGGYVAKALLSFP